MNTEQKKNLLKKALDIGHGIVRLAPAWVPRSFLMPGGRLKLARQDLYALGAERGGIDERWLASTTRADNGPGTPDDEGLSYIVVEHGSRIEKILLKEAIELTGDLFLGSAVMEKYGGWTVLTKLFDNLGPIPFHMHQTDEYAQKVGRMGKSEAYYFPPQLNFIENCFPYTFFGLNPSTRKQDIIHCLERWNEGDNGILGYSKAYKIQPGTAWDMPAGILHAPGSLVTYELQQASDVFAMFQSMLEGRRIPWDLVIKDVPPEFHQDLDYIVSMINWEKNVDPEFVKHRSVELLPINELEAMKSQGYIEKWVSYQSQYFSGRELVVFPGQSIATHDDAAYGLLVVQGRGVVGNMQVETPTLIRFGELTNDELFVTVSAAKEVRIKNTSDRENLVILKHFGSGNPSVPPEA